MMDLGRSQAGQSNTGFVPTSPRVIFISKHVDREKRKASAAMQEAHKNMNKPYLPREVYGWFSEDLIEELLAENKLERDGDNVFVFEDFNDDAGSLYHKIVEENSKKTDASSRVVIFGPLAVNRWFLTDRAILPYRHGRGVWNLALADVVIAFTGLAMDDEGMNVLRRLRALITRMGGHLSGELTDRVTHLICATQFSKKYQTARDKEIPVMKVEWIDALWEASKNNEKVHGKDEEFDKYKFRCFEGLMITLSQFPRKEKEVLKKVIVENGGIFSPNLVIKTVTYVVTGSASGEKYESAISNKIECVKKEWLYACSDQGYLLDPEPYRFPMNKQSTPTKPDYRGEHPHFDVSRVSGLTEFSARAARSVINETQMTFYESAGDVSCSVEDFKGSERADNMGVMLSGYRIFIYGSKKGAELRKLVRAGGGWICDDLNDDATHLVAEVDGDNAASVADAVSKLLLAYPTASPITVSSDWLRQCIKEGTHVDESNFLLAQAKRASNAPKRFNFEATPIAEAHQRASQAKRVPSSEMRPPVSANEFPDPKAGPSSYRKTANPTVNPDVGDAGVNESRASESYYTESMSQITFLIGKKVMVFDSVKPSESSDDMPVDQIIRECGAILVDPNSQVTADLALVDLMDPSVDWSKLNAKEVICHNWLRDCVDAGESLPVHFFHRPIPKCVYERSSLLEGLVIVPTNLSGSQRDYVQTFAKALGAHSDEMMSRKDNPQKGFRACTHLISKQPKGNKYEKALSWGVHTVSVEWLVRSGLEGKRLDEKEYRVVALDEEGYEKKLSEIDEYVMTFFPKKTASASAGGDGRVEELEEDEAEVTVKRLSSGEKENAAPDLAKRVSTSLGRYSVPYSQPYHPLDDVEPLTQGEPQHEVVDLDKSDRHEGTHLTPRLNAAERVDKIVSEISTPNTPYEKWHPKFGGGTINATTSQIKQIRKRTYYQMNLADEGKDSIINPQPGTPVSDFCRKHMDRARVFGHQPSQQFSPGSSQYAEKKRRFVAESTKVKEDYLDPNRERTTTPLSGLTVMVVTSSDSVRRKAKKLCEEMGAACVDDYGESVTHLAVDDDSRFTDLITRGRKDLKFLVSVLWLDACKEEGARVPEETRYLGWVPPHKLRLHSGRVLEPVASSSAPPVMNKIMHPRNLRAEDDSQELDRDLDKLDKIAAMRKQSLRPSEGKIRKEADLHASISMIRKDAEEDVPLIGWNDRRGQECIEKLERTQGPHTQRREVIFHTDSEEASDPAEEVDENAETEVPHVPEEIPKKVFMTSRFDERDVQRWKVFVEKRGGEVLDLRNFDDSVTHFVTKNISRNEKVLGLIASCGWLLHDSYLYDCEKAGKYLPEEEYEWGSPGTMEKVNSLNPEEKALALCAKFWRKQKAISGKAFSQFRVVVHVGPQRTGPFSRIMKAGGAKIVEAELPLTDPLDANLVLVNDSREAGILDLETLATKGIPVVPATFTTAWLANRGNLDLTVYSIPEYQRALQEVAKTE